MSQKTDTMIKLAMVFFISLLSFSIGTFVGKKYSDNQHKLASLEPKNSSEEALKTTHRDEFASNEDSTLSDNNHKMSDEEVAKLAEEFALDDHSQKIIADTDSEEKDIKEIPNTNNLAEKKATKTVANLTQKIEERKPSSVPAATTATAPNTSGMYTLQVGSFPTEAEAGKLVTTLTGKGFKATFVPASVNGKTWYRVNVGLFGTVKEAQDYKPEFLEKSKITSAIVQKAPAAK